MSTSTNYEYIKAAKYNHKLPHLHLMSVVIIFKQYFMQIFRHVYGLAPPNVPLSPSGPFVVAVESNAKDTFRAAAMLLFYILIIFRSLLPHKILGIYVIKWR